MKKNDFVSIKGLSIAELIVKASGIKNELSNLIFDKNMKKLKDLKVCSKKKKEHAQLLTLIKQKQLLKELKP